MVSNSFSGLLLAFNLRTKFLKTWTRTRIYITSPHNPKMSWEITTVIVTTTCMNLHYESVLWLLYSDPFNGRLQTLWGDRICQYFPLLICLFVGFFFSLFRFQDMDIRLKAMSCTYGSSPSQWNHAWVSKGKMRSSNHLLELSLRC